MHCPVWGCFDASKFYILMSFCAVHSLTLFYSLPSAICWVRIGRQVAHLSPWRTIYNYREANLSVRLRGRPSFCTQMSAHTPTDHTLNGHMHYLYTIRIISRIRYAVRQMSPWPAFTLSLAWTQWNALDVQCVIGGRMY